MVDRQQPRRGRTMSAPSAIRERIDAIYATFKGVISKTRQEWFDEITSDPSPRERLLTWEIVSFAYRAFFEARTPTRKCRDQALRVLLDCAANRTEAEIHRQAYKSLSIAEIRSLIAHYESSRRTAHEIERLQKPWRPGE